MKVEIVRAWPGQVQMESLDLPAGATVADARAQCGWDEPIVAIFGERITDERRTLREGDRVEFLRLLIADPKEARRRRAEHNPLPRTHRTPKSKRSV